MLHTQSVELLEHTEKDANGEGVSENLPRKSERVLLFFARTAIENVIPNGKYCRRSVRECQKGDIRACDLCGFGLAEKLDDARSHRGAHHCGKRKKEPTSSLFFFLCFYVEEHREDQKDHSPDVREIQGLAKGNGTVKNDKKCTKTANEDSERHGSLFEGLRVEYLIEKCEERA